MIVKNGDCDKTGSFNSAKASFSFNKSLNQASFEPLMTAYKLYENSP